MTKTASTRARQDHAYSHESTPARTLTISKQPQRKKKRDVRAEPSQRSPVAPSLAFSFLSRLCLPGVLSLFFSVSSGSVWFALTQLVACGLSLVSSVSLNLNRSRGDQRTTQTKKPPSVSAFSFFLLLLFSHKFPFSSSFHRTHLIPFCPFSFLVRLSFGVARLAAVQNET